MSDDFIQQFDRPRPPRPEFTAALYQRISQPMKASSRTYAFRIIALSFAMIVLIVTVMFSVPASRAFADSIIRQLQKGNSVIQTVNGPAEASPLAGFTVLAPSYIPNGYFAGNQSGEWTVIHSNNGVMANILFHNQASGGDFAITEQKGGTQAGTNGAGSQAVTVRGQPGTWMPNTDKSFLSWEENGIRYTIVSTRLTEAEVLRIAESLGK